MIKDLWLSAAYVLSLRDNIFYLVASCPLVIKDKDVDQQKKKVIGVLNVESRCLESAELLVETSTRDKFYEKIANLANIYQELTFLIEIWLYPLMNLIIIKK